MCIKSENSNNQCKNIHLEKLKKFFPECFDGDYFDEIKLLEMIDDDYGSDKLCWEYLSKRQDLDAYPINYDLIPDYAKKWQLFLVIIKVLQELLI